MPPSTKQAITDSFLHLAAKKPLEKITVRDVVDDCGINRNTFYYHFQDIFAVLEELCQRGTELIDTALPFEDMLREHFLTLATFTEKHPKACQHISASMGQSGTERYFAKGFDSAVLAALQRHAPTAAEEMQRTATVFLRHAFVGLYVDFVGLCGKINAASLADRIGTLAGGVLAALCGSAKKT